jgi:hypothetical protein
MAVAVTFGGVVGTNVTVASDTELTVTTPPHAAGVVDVVVSTSGGTATLDDAFTYVAPANVVLDIPDPIDVTVGDPRLYITRLANPGGGAVSGVSWEFRLHSDDGPLAPADVVYESRDTNVWSTVTLTADGGDLVGTANLGSIAADQDLPSLVRITVTRDTGDLTATSTILQGSTVLADETYTYVVTTDVPTEPQVTIFVPSPIAVTVGEQATYSTSLTNTGTAVDSATEEIRLHSDAGALAEADVVYETFDTGVWVAVDFTVDAGDLVFTETYPIPADLDADAQVRITVTRDVGDLQGTSSITDDDGVASTTYEYTVTPA